MPVADPVLVAISGDKLLKALSRYGIVQQKVKDGIMSEIPSKASGK